MERRRGPRRQAELPLSPWQPKGLALGLVAVALGVTVGLLLDPLRADSTQTAPASAPASASATQIDTEVLALAHALRDEAEALTPAEVALDEHAHERWMPRVARIEEAREDPDTPAVVRRELDATIHALEAVGVLGSCSPTCVTIAR